MVQHFTKKILFIAQLVILFYLFIGIGFANHSSFILGNQSAKLILLMEALLMLLIIKIGELLTHKLQMRITWPDVVLSIFFLYLIFNRFFISKIYSFSIPFMEMLCVAMLYIIFRTLGSKLQHYTLYLIMLSGGAQAIYGLLQIYGYYPSIHHLFDITGGFFNPGPYSGFLVSTFPVAMSFLVFKPFIRNDNKFDKYNSMKNDLWPSRLMKLWRTHSIEFYRWTEVIFYSWIPFLCTLGLLIALPATRSRAAWVAAAISIIWILKLIYKPKERYLEIYRRYKFRVVSISFLTIVFIMVAGIGMYHLKKDSADGRLLIWKVSASMIKDAPILGHGYEKFKGTYMTYQARFFEDVTTESKYSLLADDNQYAFNEILKTTVETGIGGILILLVLAGFLFKNTFKLAPLTNDKRFMLQTCRIGVVIIVIFSLFSYPSEILPIKIIMLFFISVISGSDKSNLANIFHTQQKNNHIIAIAIIIAISISVIYYTKNQYSNTINAWRSAFSMYSGGSYDTANIKYGSIYNSLNNEGSFLVNYGKSLSVAGEHTMAIEILERASLYSNNSIVQTALGDSYKALGRYQDAENSYLTAHHMVPGKFYPLYLLAQLYVETGENENARIIAEEIIKKEIKVPSTAINEIQEEMRRLLRENI